MKQSLPSVSPKRLIRALERASFVIDRVTGSHYILKHRAKTTLRVTIPFLNRDLKKGTPAIDREAGGTYQ